MYCAYGEAGELLTGLFVGVDRTGDGCCVMIFLAGAYSLNDFCFLLVALPARWEKLSRYDLFLVEVNIVLCLYVEITVNGVVGDVSVVVWAAQKVSEKVEESRDTYTLSQAARQDEAGRSQQRTDHTLA